VTVGELKSKERTNTTINHRPVYKLTFEFRADNGSIYDVISKTHLPHLLEDEVEEQLLYDPHNPSSAVMLDNLPGSPYIDEMGYIHATDFKSGVLPLIMPGLTILVHGTVFLVISL
jgi:hypothetical protein